VTVIDQKLTALTVDICAQHGGRDALRRSGLSAAAETCLLSFAATTPHEFIITSDCTMQHSP